MIRYKFFVYFLVMLFPVFAQGQSSQFYNIQPYTRGDTSNLLNYEDSLTPEPAKGECVYEENYGNTICKVVDANEFPLEESNGQIRPVYSRWKIENSDGSKYFLIKGGETPYHSGKGQMVIYNSNDNSVYKIVNEVFSGESSEFRWDYTGEKPNIMYFVSGCSFKEYDITTGQVTLIRDFSVDFEGCGRIINDVEGDSSGDSRYWSFMIQGSYNGSIFPMLAIITYDKLNDNILGTLNKEKFLQMGGIGANLPRPNMVDVSPLGNKVLLLWGRTNNEDYFDGPHVYDFDFTNPIKVCNDQTHGGWGFDYQGNEVYVCQINNWNWTNADADTIAYTNIATGETNTILYSVDIAPNWDLGGVHFGRFYNQDLKGWTYVTTYSSEASTSVLRNQAFMLELKPYYENPRIWRIASTHNNYPGSSGYPREAFSPISTDGKFVFWGADWMGGDGTVDTYKVELPNDWWIELSEGNSSHPVISDAVSLGIIKNSSPQFSFVSNENGIITYNGSCSSTTSLAVSGENTITLNSLNIGNYSDCTLTVTDSEGNSSIPLQIPEFTITYPSDNDLDKDVDIFDYNILLGEFGKTSVCQNQADTNEDCEINIFDYNNLLTDFGKSI